MTKKPKHIDSGWTTEMGLGAYHFEHVPIADANAFRDKACENLYAVETINWTHAEGSRGAEVHRNVYFGFGLRDAIGVAARLGLCFGDEVAEEVIGILLASDEERAEWLAECSRADAAMPAARATPPYLPQPEAEAISNEEWSRMMSHAPKPTKPATKKRSKS